MGYQIIRLKKHSGRAGVRAMLRHALREEAVANAEPGAPKPVVLAGDATSGAALARLSAALKAAPRVQKNSIQAVEFLVTASNADMLKMSKQEQDDYFKKALGFIARRFGGLQNILTAAIHRDESTPHMQVLIMPRDQDGRFIAGKMIGGFPGMMRMHDEFFAEVGQKFNLMRGETGQKAEHVPIRKFYAQLSKADKPLPEYREVPKPPGVMDTLTGGVKKIEAERAAALAHNKRVREELAARAKVAGQVHPAVISRQATRYRDALRAEKLAKTGEISAQKTKKEAAELVSQAKADLAESRLALEAADRVWAKTGAQTLDRWTATMAPEMVARVAKTLNVELVAGKPLLDQLRRQGVGSSLIQAANRLDQAVGGVLHPMIHDDRPQPAPKGHKHS